MMGTSVEVHARLLAARFTVIDGEHAERITIPLGERTGMFLPPGRVIQVQPFAERERDMGNRAMTTTVIIHPHPGTGLKVKVDLVSPIDGGVNTTEYLKAGDSVKTVYASDSMAVHVSEVPEEYPGEAVEVPADGIERVQEI